MEEFKDAKLKSGYGRNCLNCKKDNKKPRKLTKRKSASTRKARASGPPLRQESKITCRYCHVKLELGLNWTESRKNKHDYICRKCKSKSKKGLAPKIKKLKVKTSSGVPTCPKCSAKMKKQKSIYGYFWGCSKFFENGCKGTRKI